MIKSDFYPTRYTATAGEYTDPAWTLANSGDYTPENFANPYMMGYIPAGEVPVPLILSNATVDGEGADAVIHFRRANNENMLWGLSMAYGSNGSSWDGDHFYYSSNKAAWTRPQSLNMYSSYFINKAEVINYQNSGYYAIEYVSVKHNQDDTWSDGTINSLFKIYKTAEQIRKFIAGEETWTLQIAGQNTVDVDYSMVNEYGMLEYDGGDYTIYFCFYGIVQQGGASSCAVSVAGGRGTSMIPFFKFSATNINTQDATICFTASNAPGHFAGVTYNSSSHTIYSSSFSIHPEYNGMFLGITDGDLPVSEIPSRGNYKVYKQFFMYGSGIIPSIPLTEAYKFICIPNKFYKSATSFGNVPASASYNEDYTVALFNKNNKPLWNRISGSFTSILPKLQIWQYPGTDISENDFDPGHIIPPTPPRPEPDPPTDDENGGDDIELPDTTGLGGGFMFTTQYALRGSQLTELGTKLWEFNVQDYYKNFIYSVNPDTGSVKMEDVFNFFISLRAYPFPIGNYASSAGTNMYIGSGIVPLTFSSNIHVADTYLITIDAGKLTLPFWYNDYRDYQTTITLYLPYCGTVELNPADVMGGTLHAIYSVDLSTGACTAYVTCDTWDGKKTVVAILDGQMGADIPLTASNAGRVAARVMSDKINFAENIIGGLKSAAAGIGGVMSGNWAGAIQQGFNVFFGTSLNNEKQLAGMGERGAIAAPMLAGGRGLAAFKNPSTVYVQVRGAIYPDVDNYAAAVGDPAAKTVRVGDCNGFCQFVNVNTDGIITDAADAAAIRDALAAGIYIN